MTNFTPPHFNDDELLYFSQKTAILLCKRYACAACFHKLGIATHLHRVQKPTEDDPDRFLVFCTECGGNVAERSVGRITLWFLRHIGQQYLERAREIREYERRMEAEKQKEAGTYVFDEEELIKSLGF